MSYEVFSSCIMPLAGAMLVIAFAFGLFSNFTNSDRAGHITGTISFSLMATAIAISLISILLTFPTIMA